MKKIGISCLEKIPRIEDDNDGILPRIDDGLYRGMLVGDLYINGERMHVKAD
jgi:hypothetical protein